MDGGALVLRSAERCGACGRRKVMSVVDCSAFVNVLVVDACMSERWCVDWAKLGIGSTE